jgi:SRSO17 transposase
MTLVCLSDANLVEIDTLFTQFHQGYASFFQTQTHSVAKPAMDYLHGQLFTKQRQNMTQYCREVPESEYEGMQHFISHSPWDVEGLKQQLKTDVCHLLGDPNDGALIVDESGIPKQGKMSVGVQRQYCGRLGKVDNCQVGVYLAYANSHHTSLVDFRLYLPEAWVFDDARRTQCGVPKEIGFQTKAELGLEMIRALRAQDFPFGWVSFDAHYGEQPWLLAQLTREGICYMADIPCDTQIFTDCPHTEVPTRQGERGRHPTKVRIVPGTPSPVEVRTFAQSLSESDWTRLGVREIERGWLIADFAAIRVWHSVNNLPFQEVWLVIRRPVGENGTLRFSFSNAPPDTPLLRLAQMQCRRYWVERALEDAKGEAGLDQYEVRGWRSWHHHMAMTLLAMFFLLQLALRFREKAPLFTLQDAREILETFLPRKSYSHLEFIALLEEKHQARLSARRSHAQKQKQRLENLKT